MNLRKYFQTTIKSIDEEARTVEVVFSTEDVDRDNEVVVQAGWDFEDYAKNPIVLWGHNSYSLPVGKTLDVRTEGSQSIAKIQMAKDVNHADDMWQLIKQGILKTVSAGFINLESDQEGDIVRLLKNKLLEISWVSIPANQNAVALAYESGMISKKTLDFLEKTYNKELSELQTAGHKDFSMKDGKRTYKYADDCACKKCSLHRDKIKQEGGNMTKEEMQEALTEAVKPLQEQVATLTETVSKLESDTKPPQGDGSQEDNERMYTEEEVEALVNESVTAAVEAALGGEDESEDE